MSGFLPTIYLFVNHWQTGGLIKFSNVFHTNNVHFCKRCSCFSASFFGKVHLFSIPLFSTQQLIYNCDVVHIVSLSLLHGNTSNIFSVSLMTVLHKGTLVWTSIISIKLRYDLSSILNRVEPVGFFSELILQ